jgi:hypothetical protein
MAMVLSSSMLSRCHAKRGSWCIRANVQSLGMIFSKWGCCVCDRVNRVKAHALFRFSGGKQENLVMYLLRKRIFLYADEKVTYKLKLTVNLKDGVSVTVPAKVW